MSLKSYLFTREFKFHFIKGSRFGQFYQSVNLGEH